MCLLNDKIVAHVILFVLTQQEKYRSFKEKVFKHHLKGTFAPTTSQTLVLAPPTGSVSLPACLHSLEQAEPAFPGRTLS